MNKRLFVFAGYDNDCIIDESVIMYVRALSKIGDVIFYMDSDADEKQLAKVKPFTIYSSAHRHGEYDFGSYKRGYIIAKEKNILKNYDWLYLVNDSMYGPLHPIQPILTKLESNGRDASGMVFKKHKKEPHLQSWFLGMNKKVFLSDSFDSFITSIKKLSGKGLIAWVYEHGFTKMLIKNNFSFSGAYIVSGRGVYNNIKKLYKLGMPFMKKLSFARKNGALGGQMQYVLNHVNLDTKDAILKNANRVYGEKYIKYMLTKNPFKIVHRNIKHVIQKVFIEGI